MDNSRGRRRALLPLLSRCGILTSVDPHPSESDEEDARKETYCVASWRTEPVVGGAFQAPGGLCIHQKSSTALTEHDKGRPSSCGDGSPYSRPPSEVHRRAHRTTRPEFFIEVCCNAECKVVFDLPPASHDGGGAGGEEGASEAEDTLSWRHGSGCGATGRQEYNLSPEVDLEDLS